MFIVKLLPFFILQPGYAEIPVSTSVVVPIEIDSRDKKFETDIAEAEKRINELTRTQKLSSVQKAALYREEAKKALSRYDSESVNSFSQLMSSEEKAIVFFTKEIELNPNPQAYHLRGVAYKKIRRYESAIKDFTAAIGFKNEKGEYPFVYSRAEAYRLRGMVYAAQKDYPKALDDVNSAISSDPHNATFAYGDRCAINLTMGEIKEAAKDAETFFRSPVSKRDKESFSKSGQCQSLAEAGIAIDGCKSLEYFKEWQSEFLKQVGTPNDTRNKVGK